MLDNQRKHKIGQNNTFAQIQITTTQNKSLNKHRNKTPN